MKHILFIVNAEEISPNVNGGGAVLYSHLELLHKLDYQVTLLAVEWSDSYVFRKDDYKEVKRFVAEIIHYKIHLGQRKSGIFRWFQAIFKPTEFEYFFVNSINITSLQQIVQEKSIDFVWVEWRWAAIWTMKTPLSIPKIYSHHDWEYKLALLREKPSLKKRFHTFQKKRVEIKMVRSVDACISGSSTEAKEIKKISRKKVLYIPTTYHSITPALKVNKKPSLVHLGSMGTTANRLGLERFIDLCWGELKEHIPDISLKIIGNIDKAQSSLKEKFQDSQIQILGYVKNLNEVLHPEDIHIVPWEHNTGTRTRVPVVYNYQQVLIAVKDSVKCYPEVNQENAVLCDNLYDMKDQIINLYSDRERLHLLAKKGKETFNESFTSESQVKKIQYFLKELFVEKNH